MTAISVAEETNEIRRGFVDVIEAKLDDLTRLRLLGVDSPTQVHGGE